MEITAEDNVLEVSAILVYWRSLCMTCLPGNWLTIHLRTEGWKYVVTSPTRSLDNVVYHCLLGVSVTQWLRVHIQRSQALRSWGSSPAQGRKTVNVSAASGLWEVCGSTEAASGLWNVCGSTKAASGFWKVCGFTQVPGVFLARHI